MKIQNVLVLGKERKATNYVDSGAVTIKASLGSKLMSPDNIDLAEKARWIIAENFADIKEVLKLENHPFKNSLFRYPFESSLGRQFLEGFITVEDGIVDIKITGVKIDKFNIEPTIKVLRTA